MKKRLFFMHIPKTAGRYLWSLISGNFSPHAVGFWAPHDNHGLLSCRNHLSLDALSGHLPYTTRDYFPDERGLFIYTTFRDPIERTFSHFLYLRQGRPDLKIELDAFLSDPYMVLLADNVQTRMLGSNIPITWMAHAEPRDTIDVSIGRYLLESIETEKEDELLDRAIHRLDKLDEFGIKEHLAESVRRLCKKSGLTIEVDERHSEHCKHVNSFSEADAQKVLAANKLDMELYREALRRFEGR